MNWVITIPKTIRWENYERELDTVADGMSFMNYKVRYFPKEMKPGDRCYVVWNGKVRGWQTITGVVTYGDSWECTTTGRRWAPGNYIQRSGVFNVINGLPMLGFRGIRKYHGRK